uniref:Lipoprotein n=1 Tax=Onchocerca volvulus TaxID=6282 RepID=A0A8R1Y0X6_ONCVO
MKQIAFAFSLNTYFGFQSCRNFDHILKFKNEQFLYNSKTYLMYDVSPLDGYPNTVMPLTLLDANPYIAVKKLFSVSDK